MSSKKKGKVYGWGEADGMYIFAAPHTHKKMKYCVNVNGLCSTEKCECKDKEIRFDLICRRCGISYPYELVGLIAVSQHQCDRKEISRRKNDKRTTKIRKISGRFKN